MVTGGSLEKSHLVAVGPSLLLSISIATAEPLCCCPFHMCISESFGALEYLDLLGVRVAYHYSVFIYDLRSRPWG